MELKRLKTVFIFGTHGVLIVPYGIETSVRRLMFLSTCVLIVPYGIETFCYTWGYKDYLVLIVPYGIETLIAFSRIHTG